MLEIGLLAALLGGALTLLSPCSALLLPAFLAYATQDSRELVNRTLVFYAGLVTLLVPLGSGAGALSGLVNAHRSTLVLAVGTVLMALGALQLLGRGFAVGPAARLQARLRGDGAPAVFALGLTYAFAGFCSGPILGAVLTVAAGSGSPLRGAALLAVYALGMAAPAFALALGWERLGAERRARLRPRPWTIAGRRLHPVSAASGLLFLGVGAAFVAFEGTVGLVDAYAGAGLTDLAHRLDAGARAVGSRVPDLVVAGVAGAVAAAAALLAWRRRRRADR